MNLRLKYTIILQCTCSCYMRTPPPRGGCLVAAFLGGSLSSPYTHPTSMREGDERFITRNTRNILSNEPSKIRIVDDAKPHILEGHRQTIRRGKRTKTPRLASHVGCVNVAECKRMSRETHRNNTTPNCVCLAKTNTIRNYVCRAKNKHATQILPNTAFVARNVREKRTQNRRAR